MKQRVRVSREELDRNNLAYIGESSIKDNADYFELEAEIIEEDVNNPYGGLKEKPAKKIERLWFYQGEFDGLPPEAINVLGQMETKINEICDHLNRQ